MFRQYHAQRRQGGDNPLGVGVIPTGAIFYIQDQGWWRDRFRGAPVRRNPWIVESFLNGQLCAARRNRDTGYWEDVYMAGRSDMAVVRSLRDGRRRQVAIRALILHEDEGLRRDPATCPDLPQAAPRQRARRGHKEIAPENGLAARTQATPDARIAAGEADAAGLADDVRVLRRRAFAQPPAAAAEAEMDA